MSSKVIDITEKLNFEQRPKIIIKKAEIEVNNSAETMLKVMGAFSSKDEAEAVTEAIELLFDKENRQKLNKLKLSFKDFMTVVECAMNLIQGDEDGGEQ